MVSIQSNEKPKKIEYMPLPDQDGAADIRLHTGIKKGKDEEGNAVWTAEEHYFRAAMTLAYVTEHFDELLDYEPEETAEPDTEELLLEMAADHEYRICLMELGVEL